MWPDGRERVVVGRLELFRPITGEETGDPVMVHDPTAVTDGIELSPDDQIIAARRGAYLVSVAECTGGWIHKTNFAARQLLLVSILYLPAIFALLVLDKK